MSVNCKAEVTRCTRFKASQALMDTVDQYFVMLKVNKSLSSRSLLNYQSDIACLLRFVGDYRLQNWQQLTKKHVISFLYNVQSQGKAQASLKRLLSSVRGFLSFLLDQNIIDSDYLIAFTFEFSAHEDIKLSTSIDIHALLEADVNGFLAMRDKALVSILANTNMTLSALAKLDFYAIDFHAKCIVTRLNKSQDQHHKLNSNALAALVAWFELRQAVPSVSSRLFVNQQGRPIGERAMQLRISKWGAAHGFKGLTIGRIRKQQPQNSSGLISDDNVCVDTINDAWQKLTKFNDKHKPDQEVSEQLMSMYLKAHPRAR